ncbi:MAG: thioredoxin domain-containing protein [Microbacterium sp.]|nr:thioredoxin domain-containing protein [Microbacterium sp.]
MTTNTDRVSKNERRDAAREKARQARADARRRQRRNRILLQVGIGIGILVVAALIVWVAFGSQRGPAAVPANLQGDAVVQTADGVQTSPARAPGSDPAPTPAGDPADGIVDLTVYVDLSCPACRQFAQVYGAQIQQLVDSGSVVLETHVVSILDRLFLGSRYSTRSANAAACVIDQSPNDYPAFQSAMFVNQPAEGTEGLSDAEITEIANGVLTGSQDEVAQCIEDGTFEAWVEEATNRVTANPELANPASGRFATPTVVVNGVFTAPADVMTAITEAANAEGAAAAEPDGATDEDTGNQGTDGTNTGGKNGGGN